MPKYLNTPQTPLYDKSTVVFALHLAKEAIRQADEVVLVEGQMDVVASHQAGVRQVVATSGTALTMEHLRMLSKLTKNIKLAFDADRAGLAATERAIEMGQTLGLTFRMVELPEGVKDADELIAQDVEAWRSAISSAKYIVDYLFDRFEHDFDLNSAVGKRGYADRLAANLRRLGDPVEQDHYVKLLAEKTGTSEEAVKAKIAQSEEGSPQAQQTKRSGQLSNPSDFHSDSGRSYAGSGDQHPIRRAVEPSLARPTADVQREELLLGMALKFPNVRVSLNDLVVDCFSSLERRNIYLRLIDSDESESRVVESLQGLETYAKRLIFIVDEKFPDITRQSTTPFELANDIQKRYLDFRIIEVSKRLREAESMNDESSAGKLREEIQELVSKKS